MPAAIFPSVDWSRMRYLVGRSVLMFTAVAMSIAAGTGPLDAQEPSTTSADGSQRWLEFEPGGAEAKQKHIVLIAGDDEYRSEETMPMLGKILARRHGFRCTVLFPIDPQTGKIKPDFQQNIPGMAALDSADLVIMGLRFRQLPDDQMKHLVDYVNAGKPIIGTRTSTHAFNYGKNSSSEYRDYSFNSRDWPGGFGQQVLGDTWISHHGRHKQESCRGVIVDQHADSPILNSVSDVWGPSDVYGIKHLPDSATVLLRGQVLDGMEPDSQPVAGKKNDPMMPLAWTKSYQVPGGKPGRAFNTTMGASTDFACEDLRRLIVNAAYWAVGMEDSIPERADVEFVDPYHPTPFGFGNYAKDKTPADYDLQNASQ